MTRTEENNMTYYIEQRKKDKQGNIIYCLLYKSNNYKHTNQKALYYARFVKSMLFSCSDQTRHYIIAEQNLK